MSQCRIKLLNLSIRAALMTSASLGAALTPIHAFSQTDSEEETNSKELERVTVTGSRISRVDIEGANPVTILTREDLKRAGETDLGEVLQSLPMMSGSPPSTQRNNGGSGRVSVDMRGLGTTRTLVLINGKRLPSLRNDFSVIPMVIVERIEILKDGASSIYGADAVAGVVNIITRQDFEGAEFELQFGESFEQGGLNTHTSFITGGNSERGNFVISLEYTEQEESFLGQFDEIYLNHAVAVYDPIEFAEYGFSGESWVDHNDNGPAGWGTFGSTRIPYGRFDLSNWMPDGDRIHKWTVCQDSATGGRSTSDYGLAHWAPPACGPSEYNYAPINYLQTPYKRSSMFFQGNYELLDGLNAYFQGSFANRLSEQLLAPTPYDSRFDPSYSDIEPGVAISKDNYYNPFGVDIPQWRRRMVEAGGRSYTQSVNQWQMILGLEGEFAATWAWDLSYNYGSNRANETDYGRLNGPKLAVALGPSFLDPRTGEVVCGTPDTPVYDCVSLNAFTNPDTNPITQEMIEPLGVALNHKIVTDRSIAQFLMNGDLFQMSSGPIGAAFGLEHRSEKFEWTPDSASVRGQVTGRNWPAVSGSYDVSSLFAEFSVPLLANKPGAEILEIDLSARYDDFSIYDSSITWHAALRWQPVRSLLLRATAGTVYREPNVSEIFFGDIVQEDRTADPCSGIGGTPGGTPGSGECENVPPDYVQDRDTYFEVLRGGNPNLQPEEGETMTVGLAWSPTGVPGFSATLDWWRIELDNAIGSASAKPILQGCFSGTVPSFCESIERFGPESPNHGALKRVSSLRQNISPEKAEGIDWALNYTINSPVGLWGLSWFGTYNINRETLVIKDFHQSGEYQIALDNVVGRFEDRMLVNSASYPELKWRFDVDWSLGDWAVSLTTEFIDGVTECGHFAADPYYLTIYCPDDPEYTSIDPADTYWGFTTEEFSWVNTLDDAYYIDLVGRYTIPGLGSQLSVGVTNLTDTMPSFLNNGFYATSADTDTYRGYGRSWFVNFKHSF